MTWTWTPATPGGRRLLLGLVGPSGSGKTCSALRLATGIARVVGGPVRVLDTEDGRALHYAGSYAFEHAAFSPPYSSDRYAEAVRAAAQIGTRVLVIDSASHEHDGEGGLLAAHDEEIARGRKDPSAWIRPKAARRRWVQAMLHSGIDAVILCYRAELRMDWSRAERGKDPPPRGLTAVGGGGLIYELTARILLREEGRPEWEPALDEERRTIKLPGYLAWLARQSAQIDESTGEALGRWITGSGTQVEAVLGELAACDARGLDAARAAARRLWGAASATEREQIRAAVEAAERRVANETDGQGT